MKNMIAVAVLTACQFTAFPFLAIVAANTANHSEAHRTDVSNVTVVFKTSSGQSFQTM